MGTKLHRDDNGLWLHQGDAFKWLARLDTESVDLIITDYPYESLEKHRKKGTTTRLKHSKSSSNDWFGTVPNERLPELLFQLFRVLKNNSHLYMFCDDETSDLLKGPAFTAVKQRFKDQGLKGKLTCWKRIVWDKCLHPETPVLTGRGVVPAGEVRALDYVWTPSGRWTQVNGTRRTWGKTVTLRLSDGTSITCSPEHRFIVNAIECEAQDLIEGMKLDSAPISGSEDTFSSFDMAVDDDLVVYLPDAKLCWWCGKEFDSPRAASAHQARWCEKSRSLTSMADDLGVPLGKLQYWTNRSQLPLAWARKLGLLETAKRQVRLFHQNDTAVSFPDQIELTYGLGRFIGLYAAEGSRGENYVSFGLHITEKHLQNHIMSIARSFHASSSLERTSPNGVAVKVNSKFLTRLVSLFVGGRKAPEKFFWPRLHNSNPSFVRGVLQGLIEGDGSWSAEENRWTYTSASHSLALFVLRSLRAAGYDASISPYRENSHAGYWRVRWDPVGTLGTPPCVRTEVVSVELNETIQQLVDISVGDHTQLYSLGNGTISHNCAMGMGYHYRARYEFILFFEKGKRKLNNLGIPDVLEVQGILSDEEIDLVSRQADLLKEKRIRSKDAYPTEKPVDLLETLVLNSTQPGDLVIDPFMGSGATGEAALRNGRFFWGNDIAPSSLEYATKLLEGYNRYAEFSSA